MTIYAPISGKIIALSDVPDEAFAEKMLGDGIAIESNEDKRMIVKSPVSGKISVINNNLHALIIESDDGLEILIHIGIDTVQLKGKGFKSFVKEGQRVSIGDKLTKVDLKYIRANAPASMVILIVTNKPDQAIIPTKMLTIAEGTPVFDFVDTTVLLVKDDDNQTVQSGSWVVVPNPNGLHARPAASLAKQALASNGRIELEKEGGTKIDAKSATAIMALALAKGCRVRFWAADKKTLEHLSHYLEQGSGEDITSKVLVGAHPMAKAKGMLNAAIDFSKEERIELNPASPGLALGKLFILAHTERNVVEKSNLSISDEKELLKTALEKAAHSIRIDLGTADEEAKAILEAHLSFVEDPGLEQKAHEFITHAASAAYAWQATTQKMASELALSSSEYMAARAADMRDVGRRVLDMLLGEEAAPNYPENCIVVCGELTPSDITRFTKNVVAAITMEGSPTGHAAIMMRNSGIPSLYGAPKALMQAVNGLNTILDGDNSLLITNPTEATLALYAGKISDNKAKKAASFAQAKQEGATKDGRRVEISGNVSSVQEGIKATEQGGEGYGLARSEFLFYGRQTAPTEEEQRLLYQGLLDATSHDVTVRLLDAGGDKPIIYVNGPKEDNPLLGIRGMRIYGENEELYRSQFRALLRCTPLSRLKIMVPMISLISEVDLMRKVFEEEKSRLNITEGPRFGIMAETPAVCAMAEQFAAKVDFFSVGTNDLSQYTMAMDRTSARLASLSKASNPAILRLVYLLCQGAAKHQVPVAVCGAAASDPITALLFVGLGVDELAVSGIDIPEIKALIRRFTLTELQEVAKEALTLNSDKDVIDLVKQRFSLL